MRSTVSGFGLSISLLLALGGCELIVDTDKPDRDGVHEGDGDDGTDEDIDSSKDPCTKVKCSEGQHCEPQEVECLTTPCDPIAACIPDDEPATCAATLCMQGTVCVETDEGAKCVDRDDNPCSELDCQSNEICELQDGQAVCVAIQEGESCGELVCGAGEVCCNESCGICTPPGGQCVDASCEGNQGGSCLVLVCPGYCVDTPGGPVCLGPDQNPCNDRDTCDEGESCELPGGVVECVPPSGDTCEERRCADDEYCSELGGKAECLPLPTCDDIRCDDGEHCELVDVFCFAPPCPPQPECVADPDPCDGEDCGAGFHCEFIDDQTRCVPDGIDFGTPCGDNRCDLGEACCDDRCGLCAPAGQCNQQHCDD